MVEQGARRRRFFASVGPGGPGGGSNSGILFCALEAAQQAHAERRPDSSTKWRPKLANSMPGLNVFLQNPPPIRIGAQFTRRPCTSSRSRAPTPTSSTATRRFSRRRCARCKRPARRQQRPSDLQSAGQCGNRSRQGARARRVGASDRGRALRRLRLAPDFHHLCAQRRVQSGDGGRAAVPGRSRRRSSLLYVRSQNGPLVPLNTVVEFMRGVGPLAINHSGQLPAVTISFDLAPGVSLGKGLDEVQQLARRHPARLHHHQLPGHRAGLRGLAERTRDAAGDGDPRHLPGAGNPVRKLHPSDHDSVGTAVGRLRRAAHADALRTCSSTCSPSSASSCWSAWSRRTPS